MSRRVSPGLRKRSRAPETWQKAVLQYCTQQTSHCAQRETSSGTNRMTSTPCQSLLSEAFTQFVYSIIHPPPLFQCTEIFHDFTGGNQSPSHGAPFSKAVQKKVVMGKQTAALQMWTKPPYCKWLRGLFAQA